MKYWTDSGIRRLESEIAELRKKGCRQKADLLNSYEGVQSSEDASSTRDAALLESSQMHLKLGALEQKRIGLSPAPTPRQFDTVLTGHMVTLRIFEGDESSEERMIIGGCGEEDLEAIPRTCACDGVIGRQLIKKEVGDLIQVMVNGQKCDAEVLRIELPGTMAPGVANAA